MKYTFEQCWLPNQYINQQLTYLLALKRSWGPKHNNYSPHSPGLAAVQVLKDIKHSPELEMGMGLWRSGPKPSPNRLNLAPKIYTNSFSTSLQTIAAASNLSCRKLWGRIIPEPPGPGADDKSRDTESTLLFGFCLSQKVTNTSD